MQAGQMAYDRAITVFSPDGRLFQVEYAREAVKRGTTTVGLKFKDGVVLIIDKKISSRLIEPSALDKIFKIDEHIGCATSGLVADARVLVDRARIEAQINKITYAEKIPVEVLIKKICDFMQNYTQYGGVRPFGTALLVAGVDETGTHLFETDPSGAFMAYKAGGIGAGGSTVIKVFEEKYEDGMSLEKAIALGVEALAKATEVTSGEMKVEAIEIGLVTTTEPFQKLPQNEVEKYAKEVEKYAKKAIKTEDKEKK